MYGNKGSRPVAKAPNKLWHAIKHKNLDVFKREPQSAEVATTKVAIEFEDHLPRGKTRLVCLFCVCFLLAHGAKPPQHSTDKYHQQNIHLENA